MTRHGKQHARQIVQKRLDKVRSDEYAVLSDAVRKHTFELLAGLFGNGEPKSVLSYQAATKWREIDLSPLERKLSIQFDTVPYNANAPVPTASYDIVLVPLYGFTGEGFRLGHGGGWYDKSLAAQSQAYKIGIGLEAGQVAFDSEPHDIRMDCIVTERGRFETALRPAFTPSSSRQNQLR